MLENFVFVLLLLSETESNSVCFYSLFPMFCIGSVVLYCRLLSLLCIFLTRNFTDITDVCMDETAVSSDPIIAFLLDEVVVKDWCKRTFKDIMTELQGICIL
jgi:E3 ubiquitin-protein ligase HOS1